MREVQRLEALRYDSLRGTGRIERHRQDEEGTLGHVPRPIERIAPLAPEVSLEAALSIGGDHRDEVRAAGDVALDLAVVIVASFEALDVEPGGDPGRFQPGLDLLHGRQILARVADEDRILRHLTRGRREARRPLGARGGRSASCLPALVQLRYEALR